MKSFFVQNTAAAAVNAYIKRSFRERRPIDVRKTFVRYAFGVVKVIAISCSAGFFIFDIMVALFAWTDVGRLSIAEFGIERGDLQIVLSEVLSMKIFLSMIFGILSIITGFIRVPGPVYKNNEQDND